MNKKALLYSIVAGIGVAVVFCFWLLSFDFFSLGASTYQSFAFFCILYGLSGLPFGLIYVWRSWLYGICLGLPMFIVLGPLNFGDISPLEQLPRGLAALSPFSACIGAYVGAKYASIRKRK